MESFFSSLKREDIEVNSDKKGPVAAVGVDFESPVGMVAGTVSTWALPTEIEETNKEVGGQGSSI